MDFDSLEKNIRMRFYMCNTMTAQEAHDYAAIAVHQVKLDLCLSNSEVINPIPNETIRGFNVRETIRDFEPADQFKHMFDSEGNVI